MEAANERPPSEEDDTALKKLLDALSEEMPNLVQWMSSDALNIRIRAEADDLNVASICASLFCPVVSQFLLHPVHSSYCLVLV